MNLISLIVLMRMVEPMKLLKFGDQIWMGENLAYLPAVRHPGWSSGESPFYYVSGYMDSIISIAKALPNYTTYGALYNFTAASTACPMGWHLPTKAEWFILTNYLDGPAVPKMKETGIEHWVYNENATNSSGFSALPGGIKGQWEGPWSSGFFLPGNGAYFWTSTEEYSDSINEISAWYMSIDISSNFEMKLLDMFPD